MLPPPQNIRVSGSVLSQTILSLAKFIQRSINFYNIKEVNYENIFHSVSNDVHLISYTLLTYIINLGQFDLGKNRNTYILFGRRKY